MKILSLFRSYMNLSGLIWSMGARLGSTVLSFAVLYAVSHSLETDEYGLYVFLFSVGSSLGIALVFGQQILLLKHYRARLDGKSDENRHLLYANGIWLLIGCGLQVAAAAITYGFSGYMPSPYNALPIAFLFGAIFTLSEYLQSYFRIKERIALALAPRENLWRITCAVLIPLMAYGGYLTGGDTAITVSTIVLGLLVGYQAMQFFMTEGLSFLRQKRSDIPPEKWRTWNRETFFFTSNGLFFSAAAYLETILIGLLLSLEAAAFYFVAYRISMLLTLPILIADTIGEPYIAARFQENDRAGAQKIVSLLSAGSFVCAVIGGVFIYFTGPFVLSQFDPTFAQHFDVLVILCIGTIAHSFFGPGTSLNMIGGGERHLLFQRSIVFVFYIILLFILGMNFGLQGVAWASLFQLLTVHLFARRWLVKTWGIDSMATTIIQVLRTHRADGYRSPAE